MLASCQKNMLLIVSAYCQWDGLYFWRLYGEIGLSL